MRMKKKALLTPVCVCVLIASVALGLNQQVGAKTVSGPLTLKQTVRVLLANRDVSLKGNESCGSVKDPADKTVGDYLATMFSRLGDDQISWRSTVASRPIGVVASKQWQVRLSLYGLDAADNYDTGVSFRYNAKTATMIPGSFECSGTS
jgi:hypothetical protein